jgi:hypothetical protein
MSAEMKDKTDARARPVTFRIKGSAFRMDGLGGAEDGAFLVDEAQKSWVLYPEKKQAIGVPIGDVVSIVMAIKPQTKTPITRFERTGRKDVVAGSSCTEWNVGTTKSSVTSCVADDITWASFGQWPNKPNMPPNFDEYAGHFPLRYVFYDAQGVETSRLRVTKIEKKTLDASVFSVPDDYDITDLAPIASGISKIISGYDAGR